MKMLALLVTCNALLSGCTCMLPAHALVDIQGTLRANGAVEVDQCRLAKEQAGTSLTVDKAGHFHLFDYPHACGIPEQYDLICPGGAKATIVTREGLRRDAGIILVRRSD